MNPARMTLGLALADAWMTRATSPQILEELRPLGLTDVEFTLEPESEAWPRTVALVAECQGMGFHCHFHSPFDDDYNAAGWSHDRRDEIKRVHSAVIEYTERQAAQSPVPSVLVLHGACGKGGHAMLMDDTVGFLTWVIEQAPSMPLVLELLPRQPGLTKIGANIAELLETVDLVGSDRLGLCWDLGHAAMNERLGDFGQVHSEFLQRVRHVHVHDLDDGNRDHFPLVYGNVPFLRCCGQLKREGFAGSVIMEVNLRRLDRFGRDGIAMLRQSLRRLTALAGLSGPGRQAVETG